MDLTILYTFYPVALPHWMAWILFLVAILGGIATGVIRGRTRGGSSGLRVGLLSGVGLLFMTMVAAMIIMFFVHDL